jgi:hypothetical protein
MFSDSNRIALSRRMAEVLAAAPILSACWDIANTIRTVGERVTEAREEPSGWPLEKLVRDVLCESDTYAGIGTISLMWHAPATRASVLRPDDRLPCELTRPFGRE